MCGPPSYWNLPVYNSYGDQSIYWWVHPYHQQFCKVCKQVTSVIKHGVWDHIAISLLEKVQRKICIVWQQSNHNN